MCEFFVSKDPDLTLGRQSDFKERQMLVQRGAFKSTMNVIDCVQWTICFPNVRILYLTDESTLSEAFANEYRNHFVTDDGEASSNFQALFPEFCVPRGQEGPAGEFTTPARTIYRKEPTLWANSVLSRLPGWHCDVAKIDDCVNDKNSENPEQREKVVRSLNHARKLVDPGGYWDVIGTPYDPGDYYAYQRAHAEEKTFVFLSRPAWEVKPAAKAKRIEDLIEEDIAALYFPERWGWSGLRRELKADPVTFASQYLCDVRLSGEYVFTQQLIDSALIDWRTIPAGSPEYSVWDFSYSKFGNKSRDMSANVILTRGRDGELIVIECKGSAWPPQQLVEEVVDPMRRYRLSGTYIEDSNGARWLESAVQEEARHRGVKPSMTYIPIDNSKHAKRLRIFMLADLMRSGRVKISDGCIGLEFLASNLLAYSGKVGNPDDVPDVIGMAAHHLGNYRPTAETVDSEEQERLIAEAKTKAWRELLFPSDPPQMPPHEPDDAGIMRYF
jgi:predicted phage terminase large subunit-like protein